MAGARLGSRINAAEDAAIAASEAKEQKIAAYKTSIGAAVPAHQKPGLEVVPESMIALPWTKTPRDPETARAVAALLEHAAKDATVAALGREAVEFFSTHAAFLRAVAIRAEIGADDVKRNVEPIGTGTVTRTMRATAVRR